MELAVSGSMEEEMILVVCFGGFFVIGWDVLFMARINVRACTCHWSQSRVSLIEKPIKAFTNQKPSSKHPSNNAPPMTPS